MEGNHVPISRRLARGIQPFMTSEPEEHPLGDVFVELAQNPDARQRFWDQVEALRKHLLRAVLAIAVTVGISFAFTRQMVEFLAVPVGGVETLRAIEVTESIGVFMKVALLAGIAMALAGTASSCCISPRAAMR